MKKITLIYICLLMSVSLTSCAEFHRGTTDTTDMSNQADTVDNDTDKVDPQDDAVSTTEGSGLGDGEQISGNDDKNQKKDKEKEDDNNASKSKLDSELTSILNAMYANADVEEWPTLVDIDITKDNIDYFFGTEFEFDKGVAREPLVSSVAHSVSVIRVKNPDQIESIKEKIIENVDTQKWIFVEVDKDKVIVDSKNDIIVLIMTNEYGENLKESFEKLDI